MRRGLALLCLLLAATLAGLAWPVAWVALRLRRQSARLRGEVCPWEDQPVTPGPAATLCRPEVTRLVLDAHEAELRAGRARWH